MNTIDGKAFLDALDIIEKEKSISKNVIINDIKEAIEKAYKKEVDPEARIEANVNLNTGNINVFKLMKIVEDNNIEDELTEIGLSEALKINPNFKLDEDYKKPVPIESFSRIATLYIKQILGQKISEEQKNIVYKEWFPKIGEVINAEVEKVDTEHNFILVNLAPSVLGFVPPSGTIKNEKIIPGQNYKFLIQDVKANSKNFPIILSRSAPGFIKYLITLETPEIQDHNVDIVNVARIAGVRTKIALKSNNPVVDPVGACVGKKGMRINAVSLQLNGEKIDLIPWSEDPIKFIINALAPAQVVSVIIIENTEKFKDATVIVPDDQLSLAIGKKGMTAKLAAQLTGWNLDIKSVSKAAEEKIDYIANGNSTTARKPRADRTNARVNYSTGMNNKKNEKYDPNWYKSQNQFTGNNNTGNNKSFDLGNIIDDETFDKYEKETMKQSKIKPKTDFYSEEDIENIENNNEITSKNDNKEESK